MNYIIEVKRPSNVLPSDFGHMLIQFRTNMSLVPMKVYMTVSDMQKDIFISNDNIQIMSLDANVKNDFFYLSFDAPVQLVPFLYKGRGRLLPIIKNNEIIGLSYVQKGGQG